MSKTTKIDVSSIEKDPKAYANSLSIQELVNVLKYFSDLYYNAPEKDTKKNYISDKNYDILRNVLEERDPKNPYLKIVGAPEKDAVKLPYPMGSLNKIRPEKEKLETFTNKYPGPYVLSDKLDGASAQFYKDKNGVFSLYKRGNGIYGAEISHLMKYVIPKSVKLKDIPNNTSIRGEIIISKQDFKKIDKIMVDARSAASGVVNSKNPNIEVAKLCQFVAYAILNPRYKSLDQLQLLQKYGFKVVTYQVEKNISFDMLSEYFIKRRIESEFEIDGIVVIDNSKVYEHMEGYPEYGFAFKTLLADQIEEAEIVKVIWTPSMDGYLKPTIEIKPVKFKKVTVKNITAFNAKYVYDNKLGPGAVIKVTRSGDVIPYILEVVKPAKQAQMPDVPWKWNETGVDIILKDIYGEQGDIVITKKLTHFFRSLGVKYISEGIVKKLVDEGYKTISDILAADKKNLYKIEGLGPKIVDKIYKNIYDALKNTSLATLMAASHIFGRNLGEKKLQEIINKYPNIMNENHTDNALRKMILEVYGFSDKSADRFVAHFKEFKKFFSEINKIVDISYLKNCKYNLPLPKEEEQSSQLNGLKIVFTGFRDKELEKYLTNKGAKVSSTVSKSTSMVIKSDDEKDKSNKILDAEELGIPIYTRTEFIKKYNINY